MRDDVDIDEVELLSEEERTAVLEELERIAYEREKVKVDLLKEFTPSDLRAKTDISGYERYMLARMEILTAPFVKVKHHNDYLRRFIDSYLIYGISLHRQGRLETKDVLKSFYETTTSTPEEALMHTKEEGEGTLKEKLRRYLLE